jgi:streptogramin lyase
MRIEIQFLSSLALGACLAAPSMAANITGTVSGSDGKPIMGVFVIAEDAKTQKTVSVLSNEQGRYAIRNLPGSNYNIQIQSIGFKANSRPGVALSADQKIAVDFTVEKRPVQWDQLTTYQGRKLLPKTAEHNLSHQDPFFGTCFQSCHSFQNRMAVGTRDYDGWLDRVKYMSETMMAGEGRRVTPKEVEDIAKYLTVMFGPDSPKTETPDMMPEYQSLVRKFSPKAMNITYVEYDMPAPLGMGPWSGVEDRDGMIWIPYYGRGNEVIRLNPDTAEMTHFKLSFERAAGIHSVIPSPDGTVWFVETAIGRIAQLDPATGKITEFQTTALANGKKPGSHHTIRVDDMGRVWASGGPVITMYDPKTQAFTHYDVPQTYANVVGRNGDMWFTSFRADGVIARVSKDGVLSKFQPPTNGKPQRLDLDPDGNVWFTERQGNKIGLLDVKTETFREYALPGPEASPYAITVDKDRMIWYSSHEQDTINRLDPKSGEVMEYPYPHAEISMREFFRDKKGRVWYASSANNKVGYFYIDEEAN